MGKFLMCKACEKMVRRYIRKTLRGTTYSKEELKYSLNEIRKGTLTIRQAQRTFGIPKTTLFYHLKGKRGQKSDSQGRRTVIPGEDEDRLATCLRAMEKWGFGITRKELLRIVAEYVKENDIKTPFKDSVPGDEWFRNFKTRHNLSVKKQQSLEYARKKMNPFVVNEYFDLLNNTLTDLSLFEKPQQIWNLDVTSFCNDPAKPSSRTVSSPSGENNTTVLSAISASGLKAPPLIVYEGKNIQDASAPDLKPSYEGMAFASSKNGWMEADIFLNYFQKTLMPSFGPERPVLVVFNGHSTYITIPLIELAMSHDVTLLKLPPHTSHFLQPLDLSVFGPLKVEWDEKLVAWQRMNSGVKMPEKNFSEMIGQTWKNLNPVDIINGFRKAGIYPFDRNVISEDKYDIDCLKKWKQQEDLKKDQHLADTTVRPIEVNSNSSSCPLTNFLEPSTSHQEGFSVQQNTPESKVTFEELLLKKVLSKLQELQKTPEEKTGAKSFKNRTKRKRKIPKKFIDSDTTDEDSDMDPESPETSNIEDDQEQVESSVPDLGQNKNEAQVKSESQEPHFENIFIEDSNEHVDVKKEIADSEAITFDSLATETIMKAIDCDSNEHSIERQISLMQENVFVKSEDISEANTNLFDENIDIEEMHIKDEDDIFNEDQLNQRLSNCPIPAVGVGFSEANSNNLPKVELLTIMDYFHKHDKSIFAEIRRLKSEPLIGRTNYEDKTIGYVQVKHDRSFCQIKASVTPENDTMANNCDVRCTISTVTNLVVEAACQNCPGNKGGCIHCIALIMWLHRRSLDPSPSVEVSYWKKPILKGSRTRKNVSTDQSGKRKIAAGDSVPQEHIQGCKKRKIQSNTIDHNSEFNSLSIQCLATSFKKCTLTKNAENFRKFSKLHLNPQLIVKVEEVTKDQSRSSLWQEMRYGRVPSSKAYDVIRSKTVDESLEENLLEANFCDSEAISSKLERKNEILKRLSNETSMQFFKTGIFLSGESPFVEATPDAINDTFVVETKCPKTEKSVHEYLDSDGNMKLKYFYQMQLLMRLAKKEKGIFVISQKDFESSEKLIVIYCDYDEYFANSILNGINEFWAKNIYNKIL